MTNESLKSLRVRAEQACADGVNNKDQLLAALPLLMDLREKAEVARKTAGAAIKLVTTLSELCANYAMAHESVFELKKLVENQQGVKAGDIITDTDAFHLACGYDGYMRRGKDKVMTQEFLATLPEAWRKEKLEISTTGINLDAPDGDELEKYGLIEKPKNVWSRMEEC